MTRVFPGVAGAAGTCGEGEPVPSDYDVPIRPRVTWLTSVSLVSDVARWAAWAAIVAGLAVLVLWAPRTRSGARSIRWWAVRASAALIAAVAAVFIGKWLVEYVLHPFPDHLMVSTYAWVGTGVAALFLALSRVRRGAGWDGRRRAAAATAGAAAMVAVVVAGSAAQVNMQFGAFADVGAMLGVHDYRTVDFAAVPPPDGSTGPVTSPEDWTPPADMPKRGAVAAVEIPGTTSGFHARPARVYLPPAYLASRRPQLPVLVLMAGEPGSPADWPNKADLVGTMDAYAQDHGGLAPIVVVADPLGSDFGNTLCVDSPEGNAQTYLTVDVPTWIRAHLQVADGSRTMAIGGLSLGGTCALQLALAAPQTYPVFLDMSGQAEPTLGGHEKTVDAAFGGDEQRFAQHDPAQILRARSFPEMAGAFVVGALDDESRQALTGLEDLAGAAGMDVHLTIIPGGHSFTVWTAGLRKELPWLAQQLGMGR